MVWSRVGSRVTPKGGQPTNPKRGMRQPTLGDYYSVQTAQERTSSIRRDIHRYRRGRLRSQQEGGGPSDKLTGNGRKLHRDEVTTCLLTQNVRAFGRTPADRSVWMASFKRRQAHGNFDLVLLQETHVSEDSAPVLTREHAQQWGYRVGMGCPTLSLWSGVDKSKAGVGVLVHPNGRFQQLKPVLEKHWSPNFMVVSVVMDGMDVYVANIYAPVDRELREQYYQRLAAIMIPDGIRLYVGGDFNCTQHGEKDRSFQPTALHHSSAALADLIQKWRLHDSVEDLLSGTMKAPQLERFHNDYHTHEYTVAGRGLASSRLDRWYTNDLAKP